MSYNTARPYLACFLILRKDNKIACVLRENTDWMNGYYGLPAGKAEIGERATSAAVREAQEEAGVTVNKKDLKFVHLCHRKTEDDTLAWVDILFEADTWKGEIMNNEPHKHSAVHWLDPSKLPKNAIPVLRHYMEQIEAGHTFSEYGWKS